ncbi:hypothetical protein L085_07545 [Serratia sp. FS14]|uniref:hypothetical protein n=1 Tax=Serratia sp. (strain FS14) TaxID=1327989 RepID=UPI0004994CC1|nr:hypothetical protein [Serratia sp. FS14]AIA46960.1 hypothetical protein L085_07545 [Serratia sp. FS14]
MRIKVAALRTITSEREHRLPARELTQTITEYVDQHLTRRQGEIEQALTILFQHRETLVPLFFTLPEFFWNVRWDALKNAEELSLLTESYLGQLPLKINDILNKFPKDKYGHIVLLAGTVAALVETSQRGIYEALNYCLIGNNIHKSSDGAYELSMWPKRNTSWVDFGQQIGDAGDIITCRLSDSLYIAVLKQSTTAAEHNSADGYGYHIDNHMIKGTPFSINICLDYTRLNPGEQQKMQLNQNSKIDFLLACGEKLYPHAYPVSVQYAIRNDGINPGEIEFFSVENQHINKNIEPIFLSPQLATATLNIV